MISGVGRIGEALARIIAPQDHLEIALWDVDSHKINHSFSAAQLAAGADVIFLCMPSSAVRDFITSIQNEIAREVIVISLIKGLDPKTGATMVELLRDLLPPPTQAVVLGGPMLSGELCHGRPAFGVAGTTAAVFPHVESLFRGTLLNVTLSDDPPGVCWAGVLKNIYALGLGIASAADVGDNALGWLTMHALAEMQELVVELGGQARTVRGLAGVGDLVATGFSKHSRNRSVGHDLVTTGTTAVPSEGLLSLPLLLKRLPHGVSEYPFLQAIVRIVIDHADAKQILDSLLAD